MPEGERSFLSSIPGFRYSGGEMFFLIAGPCVVENERIPLQIAEKIDRITRELEIPFIFKASYRKANRSSKDSFEGIGDIRALEVLRRVKEELDIPVLTDIHSPEEASMAAGYTDLLQIPAFLCRQTDLLLAAARTGKPVNIKKGQFMAPEAMRFAVEKVRGAGNPQVLLTERGTTFGYEDLVVDFRGIPLMQGFDVPVVIDCTHSLQRPNQPSGVTGGRPELIGLIARAAVAAGADGIFIETHPDPSSALSDGANMLRLDHLKELLIMLKKIKKSIT
ncbi:MAG: 3-deoxy-8-phosphooctulonate synthase [Bacteroidales bacterium]|nr:3-deoxy-8-phosphooctulonate synthase [Bacteroidales bacterium]